MADTLTAVPAAMRPSGGRSVAVGGLIAFTVGCIPISRHDHEEWSNIAPAEYP
jgi:hypothetical protein